MGTYAQILGNSMLSHLVHCPNLGILTYWVIHAYGYNWPYVNINKGNGLVSHKRHAFPWNNDGHDPWRHNAQQSQNLKKKRFNQIHLIQLQYINAWQQIGKLHDIFNVRHPLTYGRICLQYNNNMEKQMGIIFRVMIQFIRLVCSHCFKS